MIVRVVKMKFTSVYVEEFKSLFSTVQPKIANFNGCLTVKLLQNENDTCIFFTISNWESESHLENYRTSELFQTTWAKVKANFTQKAEAWSLLEQ